MWPFSSKKNDTAPDWFQHYLQLDFKVDNTSVDDTTFVALDCETSGLKLSDQLITLGAVKCTSTNITLENLLDQKYPFHSEGKAAEIHGELQKTQTNSAEQLLKQLLAYLKNHIIVGHNIAFDVGIINEHLKQVGGAPLKNKVLDTAQMAIRLEPEKYARTVGGMSNLHLDDLCQHYHILIENRHTALGDAFMTAQLFQRLLNRLKKRGITNLRDLLR